MELDPTLGPDGAEGGGERGGEAGFTDDERLRRARELVELRAVTWIDRGVGTAFERDPFGGLAGDLPVHRPGRLEHPHHLGEIDLAEVEGRRVERKWRVVRIVRIPELSELRFVGHAVSL